jgi:2-acylglycerol O-acyltransferase 2
MGVASVSRQSCENILSHGGPGASIVIVIGGAGEALNARPGTNNLILRKRFGFVKMAINQGVSLVPVFSFGENDIYEQLDNTPGTKIRSVQKGMQKALGWTMPLFHGRGLFNYNLGVLPHRRPITTIVGTPIAPPPIDPEIGKPTQGQIAAMQAEYIAQLEAIYHKYKDTYAKDRKTELRIVD